MRDKSLHSQLSITVSTLIALNFLIIIVLYSEDYCIYLIGHPDINNLTATRQQGGELNALTFSLSASGTDLKITWYLDGQVITGNDKINTNTQAQSSTSVLSLIPQADNRNLSNLSVVVSNNDLTTNNSSERLRQDSRTVWLYPLEIAPDSTSATTSK